MYRETLLAEIISHIKKNTKSQFVCLNFLNSQKFKSCFTVLNKEIHITQVHTQENAINRKDYMFEENHSQIS